MPIREYQCDTCAYTLECLEKHGEKQLSLCCPQCSTFTLNRVMSSTSVVLKGIGCYKPSPSQPPNMR